MIENDQHIKGSRILILGITFKEDCPDIRNSKVVDLIEELNTYGVTIDVYDPNVDKSEVKEHFGIEVIDYPKKGIYDAIVVAVGHRDFIDFAEDIPNFGKNEATILDMKNFLKNYNFKKLTF